MSSFKKYIAVPEEKFKAMQNVNCDKLDRDAVKRILKISLLLAKINGYNNQYNIRGRSGKFLEDTNVIDLIEKIESEDTQIPGEDEFISLLSEAKVPTELIVNERIKLKVSKWKDSLTVAPTFSTSFDAKPRKQHTVEVSNHESKYHDFFVANKTRNKTVSKRVTKKRNQTEDFGQKEKQKPGWIKVSKRS